MPHRRMKTAVHVLMVLFFTAAAAAAPAEAPTQAERLVRAMRSDELAVSTAKRAFGHVRKGRYYPGWITLRVGDRS